MNRKEFDIIQSRFNEAPFSTNNWLGYENALFLSKALMSCYEKPRVAEIGTWTGRSAFLILSVRDDTELFCIDTWAGGIEHPKDEIKNLFKEFQSNIDFLKIKDKITIIKDTSTNICNYIEDETLDLIYIDGSHEEEDVYTDILNAYRLLKVGGTIVGDDWNWVAPWSGRRDVGAGVVTAYFELNSNKEFKLLSNIEVKENAFKITKLK